MGNQLVLKMYEFMLRRWVYIRIVIMAIGLSGVQFLLVIIHSKWLTKADGCIYSKVWFVKSGECLPTIKISCLFYVAIIYHIYAKFEERLLEKGSFQVPVPCYIRQHM